MSNVRASMDIPKEPTHLMGPLGEIVATIYPIIPEGTQKPTGFIVDFEYEPVNIKVNDKKLEGCIEQISVTLK